MKVITKDYMLRAILKNGEVKTLQNYDISHSSDGFIEKAYKMGFIKFYKESRNGNKIDIEDIYIPIDQIEKIIITHKVEEF